MSSPTGYTFGAPPGRLDLLPEAEMMHVGVFPASGGGQRAALHPNRHRSYRRAFRKRRSSPVSTTARCCLVTSKNLWEEIISMAFAPGTAAAATHESPMMSKIDKITFSLMSLMPLMSLMSQDPALRPPTERKARTAPRAAAAGGGGRSVRRLPAPRRSSLEFEAARRPPRGKLVLTNLRSVERETLLPVIDRLVDVAVMEEVTPETTHVISGQSRRTVSVLGALAVGAWLLPPAWALASLEAGRWLPEAKYEQSDEWPAAGQRRRARGTASLAPPAAVDESALTETTFGGPGGPARAPAEEEEEKEISESGACIDVTLAATGLRQLTEAGASWLQGQARSNRTAPYHPAEAAWNLGEQRGQQLQWQGRQRLLVAAAAGADFDGPSDGRWQPRSPATGLS